MKKSISLILIIIVLFSNLNLLFAEVSSSVNNTPDTIQLPKIPIFISNYNSNLISDKYQSVKNSDVSFYTLTVENTDTITKKERPKKLGSWIAYGAIIGALWGYNIMMLNTEDEEEPDPSIIIPATIAGFALGYILPFATNRKSIPIKKKFELSLLRKNEKINVTNLVLPIGNTITNNMLLNFIRIADEDLIKWENLYKLYNEYKIPFNFSTIENNHKTISAMLGKNKGEFETTSQYNERIKKEQIRKNELQAEMRQEIRISKEKWEIERFALLQEIKKEISEIEFTKAYDFKISNYNADRQSFIVKISNTRKEIVIPISEAPNFKSNSKILNVQKTFRPTLNGKWKTISDDFVLVNTNTNEIIPWEGEIPTYAETVTEFPPILSASVKLIEPSGEGYLDAEEISTIQVTLTNTGKGSAKKTRISLIQETGSTLYYDVSNTIKEILPNESIVSEFKLTVPENIENGNVKFEVSFLEEQGFEPSPLTFSAETREMAKPKLKFIDFGVDDASRDGKISKGETVNITIRIQNIGQGVAKDVALNILENRLDNVFIISDKQFKIGEIVSGEAKDITFLISTNNRVNDIIDIKFNVQEERPQFSINEKITLEIEKTQKQLEQIVFSGKDTENKIEYSKNLSIDIEQNIPKSNKSNKNALAIIFGIENYRNVSNVNFAFRDATIMKEYFSKTIGIPEEQIYFRANDEVTLGEFRKIFSDKGWLDKRVIENKTDIYFYYAGHGAPAIKEEKAFLIPFDGDPNYPVQTGYSLETVFENLSKLNANSVTVFLDACFTGANRENEMLLADARPVSIQLKNNYVKNVTVFSATSSNEISSSFPKNKHGLFSYFLMKGMQGKADINKDDRLSINELFDYTKKNVSRAAGTLDREQTPQLECLDPEKIIINY